MDAFELQAILCQVLVESTGAPATAAQEEPVLVVEYTVVPVIANAVAPSVLHATAYTKILRLAVLPVCMN
jgi:hypothetical protein